jgi:hypothetical protein
VTSKAKELCLRRETGMYIPYQICRGMYVGNILFYDEEARIRIPENGDR